jgi:hypothetical protein
MTQTLLAPQQLTDPLHAGCPSMNSRSESLSGKVASSS